MKAGGLVAVTAALLCVCFMGLLLITVVGDDSSGPRDTPCRPDGEAASVIAKLSDRQLSNAATIARVGAELHVPVRGQVIAEATALQESTLLVQANKTVPASLDLPHDRVGRDHDSLGLFQQRAGWGTVEQRMDAATSARLFYAALLALPRWQDLSLTKAAQAVQRSALPDAYAHWESLAAQLVAVVSGVDCAAHDDKLISTTPRGARTVIDRALHQVGVSYVWGGGDARGPTNGGFDCSGLMVYAYAAAGVEVPHQTQAIWRAFQPAIHDPADAQPGDMLLFGAPGGDPATIDHVGLYLGDGHMVHAPETGQAVTIVNDLWSPGGYWSVRYAGAIRGLPAAEPHSLKTS